MSQNQRPRGYSFDGSLRPANVLAAEAEVYHHSRVLGAAAASGNNGPLPRPIVFPFRQEIYDNLVPNPIPPSYAGSPSRSVRRTTDSQSHYSPHRQLDMASKPVPQFLKYMKLFASPNTLIPNCKPCLYSTEDYRALHHGAYGIPGPPQTDNYKLVIGPQKIPPGAVNRIDYGARSPTLPGISMTQLLYQTVDAERDESAFPYCTEHPAIRFISQAYGYADTVSDIRTVCSHGAITKIGLAYAIARCYNQLLQCGRPVDPNVVPGPVYADERDYRLIAVYAVPHPHGKYLWCAQVALTSSDGRLH